MKYILIIVTLISSAFLSNTSIAMCQLSRPDNTVQCYADPIGECCVLKYKVDGMTCADAWCYEYDSCAWSQLLPTMCSGP